MIQLWITLIYSLICLNQNQKKNQDAEGEPGARTLTFYQKQ